MKIQSSSKQGRRKKAGGNTNWILLPSPNSKPYVFPFGVQLTATVVAGLATATTSVRCWAVSASAAHRTATFALAFPFALPCHEQHQI
jgi:hypothetical protein